MDDSDSRCCGTGTCMINAEGVCWCGQRWDGVQMCAPAPLADWQATAADAAPPAKVSAGPADAPHQP